MESPEKSFEIVPAIYVYKGIPVVKKNQEYEQIKDYNKEDLGLDDLLKKLSENYKKVLITDLDGIFRDKPQLDLFKTITKKMEIWVDAGTRYGNGVIDVLVAGADNVVMGTKTLRGLKELEKAHELTENLIFDINYDSQIVSPNREIKEMSPSILAQEVRKIGLSDFMFTDLNHLSTDSPFDLDAARSLLNNDLNVYLHTRSRENEMSLSKLNIKGMMVEVEDLL
jgi:phosphoribosylformimino-5-aminoimidazole carboxamide ribonucleotide (ProFAR) isomerase